MLPRNPCRFCVATALLLAGVAPPIAAAQQVYFNDFDGGKVVAPGIVDNISGLQLLRSVQGWNGLGTGGNVFAGNFLGNDASGNPAAATTLTLTNLPSHVSVDLTFLLALVDSWDGNVGNVAGPDILTVTVDGSPILSETFANDGRPQSYVSPPGVLLATDVQLGYVGGEFMDAAYDMGLDPRFLSIPHTASTLTIGWQASGGGWQGGTDEWFALENLGVALTIPEPSTIVLAGIGALALVCAARRRSA